jgi:hypothetical protein
MFFVVEEKTKLEPDLDVAVVTLDPVIPRRGDWIIDSGATSHVTGIVGVFINYRPYRPGERSIRVVHSRYPTVNGTGYVVALKHHSIVVSCWRMFYMSRSLEQTACCAYADFCSPDMK